MALENHSIWDDNAEGGEPYDCQLELRVRCAPDVDGNGSAEKLVKFHWRMPTGQVVDTECSQINPNEPDLWLYERGLLVSPASEPPEVLGLVGNRKQDGQNDVRANVVGFVRLDDGRLGVVEQRQMADATGECDPLKDRRLYALSDGKLELTAREEPSCD